VLTGEIITDLTIQLSAMRRSRLGSQQPRKEQVGRFQCFARAIARAAGSQWAFGLALVIILVWALTGPLFHYSDTWQLVINTGTTIITFLMVFLIQSTQNRDSEAVQLKLDELLRASGGAHNAVLDIEELSDEELAALKRAYAALARKAMQDIRSGKSDLGVPNLEPEGEKRQKRPQEELRRE
jgi:low affinity Fe/Cu permease